MRQDSIMGKYEYLSHPADLKIRASGSTLEAACDNLIQAMSATRDEAPIGASHPIALVLKARRLTSLIFDLCQWYLEEIEARRTLPLALRECKIESTKEGYVLRGEADCVSLVGQIQNDLKAPTYHEMSIESRNDGIDVTVVIDI